MKAIGVAAALAGAAVIGACGGGGGGAPTSPSTGGGGTSAATITIGSDGRVSPANVAVPAGSRVTFVNNHNRAHDMSSDPHPEHNQCPEINVGNLQPGQSRPTQNLTTPRTCGFHDHNEPTNEALMGTIRIQ